MEFNTYKEYTDQEQVDALVKVLNDHNIQHLIIKDRDSLDGLYGKDSYQKNYSVKLKPEDFDRVAGILQKLGEQALETVEQDHYLFGFSNEELMDILAKPDEWNEFDYVLAKKILADRGKDVNEENLKHLKELRINQLAQHATISKTWLVIAYISAFLGGVLGVFTGWHLSKSMKVLPNGQRVYTYDDEVRDHGKQLMLIGGVVLVLTTLAYIVGNYFNIQM